MSVQVSSGKSVSVDTNAHEITVTFGGIPGPAGADGDSCYIYIAYASDDSGTGFTTTFNAALDYVAILVSETEIETPEASDFAGLWKNYKGSTGAAGSMAWCGEWTTATLYHVNELVYHAKTGYGQCVYICTSEHTSGASTEPEVGVSWTDKWDLYSEGGADGEDGEGAGDLKADGTVPLTANWDVGAYKITANQLESDVAPGTVPLVVASTTKVSNLNADQVDGNHMDTTTTKGDIMVAPAAGDLDRLAIGTDGYVLGANACETLGAGWGKFGWFKETNFTATPASTSTLTMTADRSAIIKVGCGLKYTIGGTVYYGMVTAITSNLLTLAGASMGGDVTALYWCDPSRVVQVDFFVSGSFADAANTALLNSDMNTAFDWNLGKAYCVCIRHKVKTDDSGANQPRVTISIAGSVVGTSNSNAGEAVAETWTSTVVGINASNYDINPDEAIEIVTDANGSNDDASNLTVSAIFVLE